MAKTRFFCIAVEGGTTDGREIQRDWIVQMAANYKPATYTAGINCEHIRGYSPEPPFNSYGTVVALKSQDVELEIAGKKEKRLGLFAQFDANDQLVAINKAGQKLFTSCEVSPDFRASGEAYLVGVAVTDNPASLGTDMLAFSATQQGDKNPLAKRKQDAANLFTASSEATIELEAAPETSLASTITSAIAAGFASLGLGKKVEEPTPPKEEPKAPANDNFDATAFANVIGTQIAAAIKPVADRMDTVTTEFATIKGKLEKTEDTSFSRGPATGGGGNVAHETDC